MTRLMALDVGEARIGVAVSDASGFLASPYTTLRVSGDEERTGKAIQQLIDETEAEGLVIGLPISLDGQIHAQGERIQTFATHLKAYVSIPMMFWDERLSTVEAQRLLNEREQGTLRKRQKRGSRRRIEQEREKIDALAAAVILQEYLDHLRKQTEDRNI